MFKELSAQLDKQLARLDGLVKNDLAALNTQLAAQKHRAGRRQVARGARGGDRVERVYRSRVISTIAERLVEDEEQIVGVLDAGAEQIDGTVRALLQRQGDVGNLGIGGERHVGDSVEGVLDGEAGVARRTSRRLTPGCLAGTVRT